MRLERVIKSKLPQKRVAEHEIFMSFNDDEDALHFLDWLHDRGWEDFQSFRIARLPEA
jgi:hypothetical protein